jgi:hypothetical protein
MAEAGEIDISSADETGRVIRGSFELLPELFMSRFLTAPAAKRS